MVRSTDVRDVAVKDNRAMKPEIPIGTMTVDQARAELLHIKGRVEAIKALFDLNTGQVPKADWPKAKALLSLLKDRLDHWFRRGGTLRAENAMNWVEDAVFYWAIREIRVHLDIARGSRPSPDWLNAFDDVEVDLDHHLAQLDKEAFKA
jgi:hypothetical protein